MRCAEVRRLMGMALAGDAGDAEEQRLQRHVRACPACEKEWRAMSEIAEAVRAVAPAALEAERNLAREVLGGSKMAQSARRTGPHPATRLTRWAVAALLVAVVGAWIISRAPDTRRLLGVVEAAMVARPSHVVQRIYDGSGKLLFRGETWTSSKGEDRSEIENTVDGSRRTWLSREGWKISWEHDLEMNECILRWNSYDNSEFEQRIKREASQVQLPGVQSEQVRYWLAFLRATEVDVEIEQRAGEFRGQKVKIVAIRALPSTKNMPAGRPGKPRPLSFKYFLTPDGSRLVREVVTQHSEDGTVDRTIEKWPIEYDTEPPASLFELNIPKDAKVTFRGHSIDPIWETMPEPQQRRIREAALSLANAYNAGDFEEFARHYDFAAGLEYGVKGKFTAKVIREHWARMVKRQTGRWADHEFTVDYAFGTARPPYLAHTFWSIYRKNPQSDGNWILYREKPSEEPGIVVLARVEVTEQGGKARTLGTQLFLKEIGGEYKVILWSPPFG